MGMLVHGFDTKTWWGLVKKKAYVKRSKQYNTNYSSMFCSSTFRYHLTEKAIVEVGFIKTIINTSWTHIVIGMHLTCPGASCSKDLPRRCSLISFPFPRVCYMFLFAGFKHNRLRAPAIHLFSWCLKEGTNLMFKEDRNLANLVSSYQFEDTFSCKKPVIWNGLRWSN